MKNNYNYTPVPLLLRAVKFVTVPMFNSGTCSEYHRLCGYVNTLQQSDTLFTDYLFGIRWREITIII